MCLPPKEKIPTLRKEENTVNAKVASGNRQKRKTVVYAEHITLREACC